MTGPAYQRPMRAPRVHVHKTSEAVVVERPGGRGEFLLNPTAFALWELCDGDTTIEEMVRAVWQLFAVTLDQAETDVADAIEQMRRVGLIT